MAKLRTAFFCTDCGNETPRWEGQCPTCRSWNTLVEEPSGARRREARTRSDNGRAAATPILLRDVAEQECARWISGLEEWDFVLGGGTVPGSVVLVGGEPGIGKSTLLLQVAARLRSTGKRVLYVAAEESAVQVRLRAERLGTEAGEVAVLAETDLEPLLAAVADADPQVMIVDSIQTIATAELEGAPGGVGQVRECSARLQRFAKQTGTAVFLVGHVTKGGGIAGPKTLEHLVDTVLYFEATGPLDTRVLRATKNRFGSTDEIGVFRMTAAGLVPSESPSELFVGERSSSASGTAVVPVIEGTRPLLVEVQALASRAAYGAPQRVSSGVDQKRLALLLAVLEKRAGLAFGQQDVFLNVVGGLRLADPAADAAVAAALASSALERPLPAGAVVMGELGLGGEIRGVGQLDRRLAEAARLGFDTAYVGGADPPRGSNGVRVVPAPDLRTLLDALVR